MVGVDEELGALIRARRRQRGQLGHDARVFEENGRDEHGARPPSLGREPLRERLHRPGGEPDDREPLLGQPAELASQRVELTVGRDDLRPFTQRQSRQEPEHELVRVRRKRNRRAGIGEQPPDSLSHTLRLRERALPLEVGVLGGVLPRLKLSLAGYIRPRLMRVPGQVHPLGHAKGRVVLGKPLDQSSPRIVQRSGKNDLWSVVRRYSAPYPPVPVLEPIVRSTIFTWW